MNSHFTRPLLALTPLVCVALIISGCAVGGDAGLPLPPAATPYAAKQSKQIDELVAQVDAAARDLLRQRGYKAEQPELSTSTASPAAIFAYYKDALRAGGWSPIREDDRMPSRALLVYQKGDELCVVMALDTSAYFGQGVLIYSVKATH